MRKDEKEVLQYQLDREKAILKELEKQYKAALEAIDEKVAALLGRNDANLQHVIFQVEHQKALRRQIEGVLNQLHSNEFDTISDYLANCYEDGFIGSMYSMHSQGIPVIVPIDQNEVTKAVVLDSKISEGLYESIGVDVDKMKKSIRSEITRGISAGMSYNEIARNISKATKAPLSRAKTIVYTEGHRVQQASNYDGQRKAKSKGADVVKQWNSILDGNTRPTHRKLDGQIREVEEPFEMDGKKAMYPGEFGNPAEDCNCRCVSMTRARWALDEEELQTLKDRAEYFGLDKSENFADFKKKYLQSLENAGKSGTIDLYRKVPTHRKTTAEGRQVISKPLYNKLTNSVTKKGGAVITADEQWMEYLAKNGASAVTYDDVIILRPDATTTEVLEEVYHFFQNRSGVNSKYSASQRKIMNEIEAQEYLISVADKYKIPEAEREETKELLKMYKADMEKLKQAGEWDD